MGSNSLGQWSGFEIDFAFQASSIHAIDEWCGWFSIIKFDLGRGQPLPHQRCQLPGSDGMTSVVVGKMGNAGFQSQADQLLRAVVNIDPTITSLRRKGQDNFFSQRRRSSKILSPLN